MMHSGSPALPAFRRRALPFAVAACALAFLSGACGSGGDDAASGGPPGKGGGAAGGRGGGPPGGFGSGGGRASAVPVEVAEIVTGNIAAFIETNGALEAEREVDVVSRTGGPITEIGAEEGMFVEEGALLARIDETETRAQVEISRVALAQAETAYERARVSFENQIVSQEVYDAARSALDSARAQLDGSLIQHDYTRITAPFAGLIIERAVKFGETVTNGQRLFRISDFEPLLCHIAAPERDLTRLSVDQPAFLEVEAFPGERFAARVLRVSPVVDAATGTIRVTLEVDRQGRLSPGMFATVRLVTDTRRNALLMPKRALSLDSLADTVFVVEDGAAARRNVTLGYEEDETVEVLAGLDAGDRVIVVGQDGLTDATPVQILAGPGAEEAAPPERRARAAGGNRPGAGRPGASGSAGGPPAGSPPGSGPPAGGAAGSGRSARPAARRARRAPNPAGERAAAPTPTAPSPDSPAPPPPDSPPPPPSPAEPAAIPEVAPVVIPEAPPAVVPEASPAVVPEAPSPAASPPAASSPAADPPAASPPAARPSADAGGAGSPAEGPPPDRLERIRERMRQRGLSEEQIEARMAAFADGRGGGGRPGGPGARPGGAARTRPDSPPAPSPAPAPPAETRPAEPPPPQASPPRAPPPAEPAEPEAPAPAESAEAEAPPSAPPEAAEPAEAEETEEDLEALRQRLRERGLSDEQIERFLARRRRPGALDR